MEFSEVTFHDQRTGRFRTAAHWERNPFFRVDTLSAGIANFVPKTGTLMGEEAIDFAIAMLDYAKENAPWSDRTGAAREGLDVTVDLANDSLNIALFHTVSYGIWLEVRWGGKYAIIIPTVEQMGSQLFNYMHNMLSETRYYE